MLIRLQKYMAEAQVASRRKSEEMILAGRVQVNGETVTCLGTKVNSGTDVVTLDGEEIHISSHMVYIMLNKPEGCVTTAKDQFGRKSVLDYVKDVRERIYPVGRLDYDTSGLLLLTNDGDITYRLTHPSHNVNKTYIALTQRKPSPADMDKFRTGIVIDGRKTAPAQIEILSSDNKITKLKITIHEGRNRQVRKMCSAINCNVIKLKRTAIGSLELGTLKKCSYRYLTPDEIEYIRSL